jgi:hypothetical protein
MQPGEQPRDASFPRASAPAGVLVMRPLGELRKHPAYTELNLSVSSTQLAALEDWPCPLNPYPMTECIPVVVVAVEKWKAAFRFPAFP